MKTKTNKIIAYIITFAMLITMFPALSLTASASGGGTIMGDCDCGETNLIVCRGCDDSCEECNGICPNCGYCGDCGCKCGFGACGGLCGNKLCSDCGACEDCDSAYLCDCGYCFACFSGKSYCSSCDGCSDCCGCGGGVCLDHQDNGFNGYCDSCQGCYTCGVNFWDNQCSYCIWCLCHDNHDDCGDDMHINLVEARSETYKFLVTDNVATLEDEDNEFDWYEAIFGNVPETLAHEYVDLWLGWAYNGDFTVNDADGFMWEGAGYGLGLRFSFDADSETLFIQIWLEGGICFGDCEWCWGTGAVTSFITCGEGYWCSEKCWNDFVHDGATCGETWNTGDPCPYIELFNFVCSDCGGTIICECCGDCYDCCGGDGGMPATLALWYEKITDILYDHGGDFDDFWHYSPSNGRHDAAGRYDDVHADAVPAVVAMLENAGFEEEFHENIEDTNLNYRFISECERIHIKFNYDSLSGGFSFRIELNSCEDCGEFDCECPEPPNPFICSECFTYPCMCHNCEKDGHIWGNWHITTPATTTAKGERTRTCSECGEIEKEEIPMVEPVRIEDVETIIEEETQKDEDGRDFITLDLETLGATAFEPELFELLAKSDLDYIVIEVGYFTFIIDIDSITEKAVEFDFGQLEIIFLGDDEKDVVIEGVNIPENSIIINPPVIGDFGFELTIHLSKEQLESADFDLEEGGEILMFHFKDGSWSLFSVLTVDEDGNAAVTISSASFFVLSAESLASISGTAAITANRGTTQLSATIDGKPLTGVTWSSDNTARAAVNASGLVTAAGGAANNGTATITIKAGDTVLAARTVNISGQINTGNNFVGGGGVNPPSNRTLPTAPIITAGTTVWTVTNIPRTALTALGLSSQIPVNQIRITAEQTGNVSVSVGADYAGQNAVLVKFNAETGQLEFVSAATVGANGSANINITQTGDFLVLTFKTGDISGTGTVDTSDALAVLRHAVGLTKLSGIQTFVANGKSGDIDTSDALNILRYAVGLIDRI